MSEATVNGLMGQDKNIAGSILNKVTSLVLTGIDTDISVFVNAKGNLSIEVEIVPESRFVAAAKMALLATREGAALGIVGFVAAGVIGAGAGVGLSLLAETILGDGVVVSLDTTGNVEIAPLENDQDQIPSQPSLPEQPSLPNSFPGHPGVPTTYPNSPVPGAPANPNTTVTIKTGTKDPSTITSGGDRDDPVITAPATPPPDTTTTTDTPPPATPPTATPPPDNSTNDTGGKRDSCVGDPVILDLDGDGVELIDISNSQVLFDWMGNGFAMLTGWAAADDGFLAYDKNSDGVIRDADEISFTSYYHGANTDLEGLKGFDSNTDGILNALDDEWSKFGVWQDANSDGTQDDGEFTTLAERSISQISLTSDNQREEIGHNVIHGKTSYMTEDLELHELADTGLLFVPLGVKEVSAEQQVYDLIVAGYIVRLVGTSYEAFAQNIDMETDNLRSVFSGNGADVISAAASNNNVVIYAGAGDDTITGGAGNDFLNGGSGADVISGGAGDDIILFDAQDLERGGINGGDGYDFAIYADDSVAVNLALGDYQIEAAAGGDGNDVLSGTEDDNLLLGAAGDDILFGGNGNNLLVGGEGSDVLFGGTGNDILFLDDEDSWWHGGSGVDTAFYQGEKNLILDISSTSIEIFFSGDGHDILYTIPSRVAFIHGGDGADQIHGGLGDDWLAGGRGSDALYGGYSDDTYFFQRGDGIDAIYDFYLTAYTHTETYLFSNGEVKNVVHTTRAREHNAGNDKLVLGDEIALENLFISRADINLNIDLVYSSGNDLGTGEVTDRIIISNWDFANQRVENLELADGLVIPLASIDNWLMGTTGDDNLIGVGLKNWLNGGEGNDKLVGAAGDDVLAGGDGDDLLVGGRGADVLYGGAGSDTVSYEHSFVRVSIDLQGKVARCGEAAGDTLHGIENIIGSRGGDKLVGDANSNLLAGRAGSDRLYGGEGNDKLEGGAGRDFLYGQAGDDTLAGGADSDHLYGGDGNDILQGGAGQDVLDGGAGEDRASYENALEGLLVSLDNSVGNSGEAKGDYLNSIEILQGSKFDDQLIGDANDNQLLGGDGADFLQGGLGADLLQGGNGADSASYAASKFAVRADLADSSRNKGEEAIGDIYESIENLHGSQFNDMLVGDAGDNILEGAAGGDLIYGGEGVDSASYLNSDAGVEVSLHRNYGGYGHAEGDRIFEIENILGSRFNDQLTGDAEDNSIDGYKGADTLYGRQGDDIIYGGDGDDRLHGEAGNDILQGGKGADTYIFRARDGQDRIHETVGDENMIIFKSVAEMQYVAEDFSVARWDGDLRISSNLGNEVTLTDYYANEDLGVRIFTQSESGILAEISVARAVS